jgi:hypothetical protein
MSNMQNEDNAVDHPEDMQFQLQREDTVCAVCKQNMTLRILAKWDDELQATQNCVFFVWDHPSPYILGFGAVYWT